MNVMRELAVTLQHLETQLRDYYKNTRTENPVRPRAYRVVASIGNSKLKREKLVSSEPGGSSYRLAAAHESNVVHWKLKKHVPCNGHSASPRWLNRNNPLRV